jgi:protein-S-isoprenylcysteine O-methyltransferase Ste14
VAEIATARHLAHGESDTRDPVVVAMSFALFGGQALGIVAAANLEGLALPGPDWWPPLAGAIVFSAGIALRAWSILTLGRFFRYSVVLQDEHRIVEDGPYRLLRHPSYTGLVLAALGVGLALGNWLSIALCFGFPLLAFGIRLRFEERALVEHFGQPYRDYMARTWRLVPHVW